MRACAFTTLIVLAGCGLYLPPAQPSPDHLSEVPVIQFSENLLYKVFAAIRSIETGGHPDPENAKGSHGELGPFQITRPYFQDAIDHDKGLTGLEFEGVRDSHISRLIMLAYWDRYATKWTPEELCRLHNGGPTKRYTDDYWDKCSQLIQ